MRTAAPGPIALPLATRSVRRFVSADALPVVVALLVNHVDAAGTVPNSVAQCTDLGATPIPGLYRVNVDTSAVALGSRIDVLARATLAGRVVDIEWSWVVGEGEFADAPPNYSEPLEALNDDFDDNTVDPSWTVSADGATIVENANGLVFFPPDGGGAGNSWGGAERGPVIYKAVTGDFRVTIDVQITNDAGDGLPPAQANRFHMGGVMVLDPRVDQVDAIDCGIGMWNNDYTFQTKTTVAGATTLYASSALSGTGTTGVDTPEYEIVPGGGATSLSARLRISRVGQLFTVDVSYDGGGTIAHDRAYDRTANPMPAEILVGPMAYSAFAAAPDFQARFPNGITFESL